MLHGNYGRQTGVLSLARPEDRVVNFGVDVLGFSRSPAARVPWIGSLTNGFEVSLLGITK
jgi:hypothetical protein